MTAQEHDYLEFDSEIYSILDVSEIGRIGRPILSKYGIETQLIGSTNNPSGYSARYEITQNSLRMNWLLIRGGVKEYKTIGVARPIHQVTTIDGRNFDSIYEGLFEPVEISGYFSIGRELEFDTHPDASINYKRVFVLKFEHGHLNSVNDISDQIASLRNRAAHVLDKFEREMPASKSYLKYTAPEYQSLMSEAGNLTKMRVSYPSARE